MAYPQDTRITELTAQELAQLNAKYKADPDFLRLLTLASESASTFNTFITT